MLRNYPECKTMQKLKDAMFLPRFSHLAGRVTQVVEHLHSKPEAVSPNPSAAKINFKKCHVQNIRQKR
jgi:hypothetical protein